MGRVIAALILASAVSVPTSASELQVYPLRLELGPKTPTGLVTVGNRGTNDTLIQITVSEWKQVDGQDILTPTRDILVNPPVFPLKGGAQQIARFGLRIAPGDVERTYRFTMQEVPQRPEPGFNGLATLLKMNIPIFVPPVSPSVSMNWRIQPHPNGALLTLINGGNVHVQVRELKLSVGGQAAFEKPVNVYVLPGVTRIIQLELDRPIAPGATVQLQASSDQIPFSVALKAEAMANGTSAR